MKRFYLFFIALLVSQLLHAQVAVTTVKDTATKSNTQRTFTSIEDVPAYPGGIPAFYKYISKNLHYPEVARLIGLNGKLNVSFVVDTSGKIIDAIPKNCIGAGCEAEAVRLLEASPTWKPGTQNGRPVRVAYSVPINFSVGEGKVTAYMGNLRKSDYGFVFNIKGTLYTIDEAEKILGNSFVSDQVQSAEPFYNYNKTSKFDMPDKKEVYLLVFKST
jgi:periplasmic protein TonB